MTRFCCARQPANPSPAKPSAISVQVAGSGAAVVETSVIVGATVVWTDFGAGATITTLAGVASGLRLPQSR